MHGTTVYVSPLQHHLYFGTFVLAFVLVIAGMFAELYSRYRAEQREAQDEIER